MLQITAASTGTLAVGDPWPEYRPTRADCQTGCPMCTCCSPGCPYRDGTGTFIVIGPTAREAIFDPPKLKAKGGKPFHERINRKPWERR